MRQADASRLSHALDLVIPAALSQWTSRDSYSSARSLTQSIAHDGVGRLVSLWWIATERHNVIDELLFGSIQISTQVVNSTSHQGQVRCNRNIESFFDLIDNFQCFIPRRTTGAVRTGDEVGRILDQLLTVAIQIVFTFFCLRWKQLAGNHKLVALEKLLK